MSFRSWAFLPDPSFGKEGLVQLPNRAGPQVNESARSILVLEDGDILIAGVGVIYGEGVKEETYDWLAQLTPNGSLDPSFGQDGKQYVPALTPYQGERGVTLASEPDGVIVLAGDEPTGGGHWQAAAWGFLSDGGPDHISPPTPPPAPGHGHLGLRERGSIPRGGIWEPTRAANAHQGPPPQSGTTTPPRN